MKKIVFCFILFAFLLYGCNLPLGNASNPTPKTNVLATAVAQTLTAKPVLPTSQPANPTSTLTEVPSTATFTAAPPATETSTATATPASMRSSLGSPTWQSLLDNGKSFDIGAGGYQDDNTKITVENGAMNLSSNSFNGFRTWRLTSPAPKDFYLEAVFKTVSCSGNDQYGLVYRAPDYSSGLGYYFGISCTGNYSLYQWSSTGASVILNGSSALINPGTNQVNRIGVMAKGNNFTFYINEKSLQDFSDTNLVEAGHIGTFIGSYSGNLAVQMDEIAMWELK